MTGLEWVVVLYLHGAPMRDQPASPVYPSREVCEQILLATIEATMLSLHDGKPLPFVPKCEPKSEGS